MIKLKRRSTAVFNYAYALLISIVVIGAGTVIFKSVYNVIFGSLVVFILIFAMCRIYDMKKDIREKRVNQCFIVMAVVMLITQLIIGFALKSTPITDWGIVDKIAHNYAINGNFDKPDSYNGVSDVFLVNKGEAKFYMGKGDMSYMARYPNNNGLLILLSLYYRVFYIIFGSVPTYAPVVLNVLFIFTAFVFTFLISKLIFKPIGSLITATACFLFLPFYTYTPYYYSDSLSLPFVTIAVYLIMLGIKTQHDNLKRKVILLGLAGFIIALGYSIKGSLLVILAGGIVYTILSGKLKHSIISLICLVLAFAISSAALGAFTNSFEISTQEERYEYQYPLNHWVMMGLGGNGGYNNDDSLYTKRSGNYDEKVKADNEKIKQRLAKMGKSGLAEHIYKKLIYTWSDGTYWISHHLNTKDENGKSRTDASFLYDFVLKDGKHYTSFSVYSNVYHIIMLALMLVSVIAEILKKRVSKMTFIHGMVFGVIIFFLIWEARSRYIYNFTPLFILSAVNGLVLLCDSIKFRKPIIDSMKNAKKISIKKIDKDISNKTIQED